MKFYIELLIFNLNELYIFNLYLIALINTCSFFFLKSLTLYPCVQVHALLISHLRSQMPVVGKDRRKAELIKKLHEVEKSQTNIYKKYNYLNWNKFQVYLKLQDEHNIPAGDFPDVDIMREKLKRFSTKNYVFLKYVI